MFLCVNCICYVAIFQAERPFSDCQGFQAGRGEARQICILLCLLISNEITEGWWMEQDLIRDLDPPCSPTANDDQRQSALHSSAGGSSMHQKIA